MLAVEAFEATDGFGVMDNAYDRVDFIANAAGVVAAVLVDTATSHVLSPRRRAVSGAVTARANSRIGGHAIAVRAAAAPSR